MCRWDPEVAVSACDFNSEEKMAPPRPGSGLEREIFGAPTAVGSARSLLILFT